MNDDRCRAPLRIALCHLESLVCLPALDSLFTQLGEGIGLVILSDRFGSKHGGLIRQLLASIRRSGLRLTLWLGFDIVAAQIAGRVGSLIGKLTHRPPRLASVRALAKSRGAAVLDVADVNSTDTIAALKAYAPDLVVVMNFDQVLRREFIAAAGTVINVHPSLLPALRGPCPVLWALVEGRRQVGVSVHLIEDEKIDAGPVLMQSAYTVDQNQSVAEITSVLFEQGAALVVDAVKALQQGRVTGQPQDAAAADYRGFPARTEMGRARRAGVRLCRSRALAKLLTASVG